MTKEKTTGRYVEARILLNIEHQRATIQAELF